MIKLLSVRYLTIGQRTRDFYELVVNEAKPGCLTARRKRGSRINHKQIFFNLMKFYQTLFQYKIYTMYTKCRVVWWHIYGKQLLTEHEIVTTLLQIWCRCTS